MVLEEEEAGEGEEANDNIRLFARFRLLKT
jgi:hypothetical protein